MTDTYEMNKKGFENSTPDFDTMRGGITHSEYAHHGLVWMEVRDVQSLTREGYCPSARWAGQPSSVLVQVISLLRMIYFSCRVTIQLHCLDTVWPLHIS
eukprot:scaffold332499_cov28-Prasinocladus_malaysianus.AAC.1